MKKVLSAIVAAGLVASLAACSSGSSSSTTAAATTGAQASGSAQSEAAPSEAAEDMGETVTLHMGGGLTQQSPQYESWQEFAEEVKKESNGTINISLDLSGALGSDREIIEGVMNGSIEMMHMSDGSCATVIPETGFVALPFLFPTRADAEKHYFNGELGTIYREIMERNNIKILGNLIEGDPRWISNSIREITKPEDLSGLKIRVMDNPMWISYFTKLGTNPVAMSVSEVASALQQKVIDGQDNGPLNTYFYGFYDFQKYMTKTNHGYAANYICINTDVFNKLSPKQQEILSTCADKYSAQAYEIQSSKVDSLIEEMEQAGMHTIDCTPELTEFLRNAATEIWNDDSITEKYNADAMTYIKENLGTN